MQMFDYNPVNGELRWKIKPHKYASRSAGDIAGTCAPKQYSIVKWKGECYKAHNLIWIMNYGEIPEDKTVDHINKVRSDNRLDNLRAENKTNQNLNRNSRGFSWDKQKKKWKSALKINKRSKFLGYFSTALQARLAYEAATKLRHTYLYQDHFTKAIKTLVKGG